jgi:hypothetical protein
MGLHGEYGILLYSFLIWNIQGDMFFFPDFQLNGISWNFIVDFFWMFVWVRPHVYLGSEPIACYYVISRSLES